MGAPDNEAFSLAQIFFGPFANFFRRRRAARVPGRRVLFETLESRLLLSADLMPGEFTPLVFNAPDNQAADSYLLRLNGDYIELLDGSSVILSQALDATSGVVVTGEDGYDDVLTVDFSSGFFMLAGGIRFDGGADGMDLLTVTGGNFDTITHTATSAGPGRSGNLVYDDGAQTLVIDYANLEPIDTTGSHAGNLVFNLLAVGGTQPILEDDGIAGNNISQIRDQQTPARFETMTFSSTNIASLTLNLLGGSIPLTIASLPDYAGALAVNGTQGLCSVNFTGSDSFSTLSIAVIGAITDSAAANLAVAGAATLSAGSITLGDESSNVTNFGTLQFNSGGRVTINEDGDMDLAGNSAADDLFLRTSGFLNDAAGASIVVSGMAVFDGLHVNLADAATNVLDVTESAFFRGLTVTVAPEGTANFGVLAFAADTVFVVEDSDMGLWSFFGGPSSARQATLVSAGFIADAVGTSLSVTDLLDLSAPTFIDLDNGIHTMGRLTFASNGAVSISQHNDMVLAFANRSADLTLISGGGSITEADGGSIRATNATLTALTHIGSAGEGALDVDLTSLTATSGTGVFINELDTVSANGLRLNKIIAGNGSGEIDITVAGAVGDIINTNRKGDLNLFGGAVTLSAGRHIGVNNAGATQALDIFATSLTATSGTAGGAGNIDIDSLAKSRRPQGEPLALNAISAAGGSGHITINTFGPESDIVDGNGAGLNLKGSLVSLTAGRHIGTALDPLDTEVGTLSASSGLGSFFSIGDIYINELASGGSLATGVISAAGGNGTLSLKTNSDVGDITDGNGAALNLVGLFVELSAGRHIGSAADAIETNVVVNGPPLVQTGLLTATAGVAADAGDIYLVEDVSGVSLRLGTLTANEGAGTISLIAAGQNADIIDGNGAAVNLVGAAVTLHAGRYIGFNFGVLDALDTVIDSLFATAGTNATSGTVGEIYIDEREADLDVLEINSTGRVVLTALSEITVTGNIDVGTSAITLFAPEVTIAPSGVLNIDLGPFNASTRYQILGTVNLGGTLEAELVALPPAERATFMTFLASTGDFAATHLPPHYVVERHDNFAELVFYDTPTISIGDATVTEGDAGTVVATFDVTLSSPAGLPVTVDYATADGSASAGIDYEALSGTLTFSAGETRKQIFVTVNGDLVFEADEIFTVTLSDPLNGVLGDAQAVGTIVNDDRQPEILIGDATIVEGDSDVTSAVFTLSLSSASAIDAFVHFATLDGTAIAGTDYLPLASSVHFAPGETSREVRVQVIGDLLDEFDETFTLRLTGSTGALIGDIEGLGSIVDDDPEAVLSVSDAVGIEGERQTPGTAEFDVTLSGATSKTVTVQFATADGTALAGFDYADATGVLTFAPGETSKRVSIGFIGDLEDERDETFSLELSGAVNASIGDAQGLGLIRDDETTVSIGDASVLEGFTQAVFTLTLTDASPRPVSVQYLTADGTALRGSDYNVSGGIVTFAPGETTQQVFVEILDDALDEAEETFTVGLSGSVDVFIADGEATGTIVDNDPPPGLVVSNAFVVEGDTGTTVATFLLQLEAVSAQTVTVDYATVDGTALAGSDYEAAFGTLTFAPGEQFAEVSVTVNGDLSDELDESFRLELLNPVNAVVFDIPELGNATIFDDDEPPTVSVSDATVLEGDGGTTVAVFNVSLSNASGLPVTLNFATADGSALAGGDYVSAAGTITFAPGQVAHQIFVTVNGDLVDEADETFTVTLSSATNATIADAQGIGTIVDDDDAANHAPTVDAGADQVVGLQDTQDHGKGHGKGHDKHDQAEVTIAATYSDLDAGDGHSATIDWGDGSGVQAVPAAGGSVGGVHVYTEAGRYTVIVTVDDGQGGVASDTLTITVKKPVETKNFEARKDEYQLEEDSVLSVNAAHGVLANDQLPGGATVEARLLGGPEHGTLVFNADGSFTYTPDADFHGKDSFRYEFTDGTNVSRAIEVELKVKDVPDARRPRVDWGDCWREVPFMTRC